MLNPNTQRPVRTGVFLLGALGDIATTLIVGARAIGNNLASDAGMVTALPPMSRLDLVGLDELAFGGLDIRDATLPQAAEEIYRRSHTYTREVLDGVWEELSSIDSSISIDPQLAWNPQDPSSSLPPLGVLVERLRSYISAFRHRHRLERIVVFNLVSAEPGVAEHVAHHSLDELHAAIAADRKDLITPSIGAAYAAMLEDCAYINFTPNNAATCEAIQKLAQQRGLPFYGNDGKTGETLVKTALAPMFAFRNLQVMSWEGVNMLGNADGATLHDPHNRAAKLQNKAGVLEQILKYPVHSGVDINYVPSLGDWKTAWDLIHFRGFLDVAMTMQFTWQGSDSILAAPLVLDMVRMAELALRCNESGPMRHLSCFFKNPIDVNEMALAPQFNMLVGYAEHHLEQRRAPGISNTFG